MAADFKIETSSSIPANSVDDIVSEIKTDTRQVYLIDIDATLLVMGADGSRYSLQLNPLLLKKLKEAPPDTITYLVTKRSVDIFDLTLQQVEDLGGGLDPEAKKEAYRKKLIVTILSELEDNGIKVQGVSTPDDHATNTAAGSAYNTHLKPLEENVLTELKQGRPIDFKKRHSIRSELIKADSNAPETKQNDDEGNKNRQLELVSEGIQAQHPTGKFKYHLFDDVEEILNNARHSPLQPQLHHVNSFHYDPTIWRTLCPDSMAILEPLLGPAPGQYQIIEDMDAEGQQIFEVYGPTKASEHLAVRSIILSLDKRKELQKIVEVVEDRYRQMGALQRKHQEELQKMLDKFEKKHQEMCSKLKNIFDNVGNSDDKKTSEINKTSRETPEVQPISNTKIHTAGSCITGPTAEENKKTIPSKLSSTNTAETKLEKNMVNQPTGTLPATWAHFFANRPPLLTISKQAVDQLNAVPISAQLVQKMKEADQGNITLDIEPIFAASS